MRYAAIALLFLLSACASGKWYHSSANEERFRQDALECDYEARKVSATIRSGVQAGFEQAQLSQQCMQVRGYVWRAD